MIFIKKRKIVSQIFQKLKNSINLQDHAIFHDFGALKTFERYCRILHDLASDIGFVNVAFPCMNLWFVILETAKRLYCAQFQLQNCTQFITFAQWVRFNCMILQVYDHFQKLHFVNVAFPCMNVWFLFLETPKVLYCVWFHLQNWTQFITLAQWVCRLCMIL